MAASNATLTNEEYTSKAYEGSSYKDTIRDSLKRNKDVTNWGFSIVRCSYSSQPRWEKYLRKLRSHVDEQLDYKEDTSLREALEIPLIEDETLDGATWEQARDRFDAWVLEDLQKSRNDFSETWKDPGNDELRNAIQKAPRWEFFIFADQASMDSVVDCGDRYRDQHAPGAYYFTIVATGLVRPRGWKEEGDEDSDDSDEMTEEIKQEEEILAQRSLHQKFRATDYLQLYSSILEQRWPDEYFEGAGGISSVGFA